MTVKEGGGVSLNDLAIEGTLNTHNMILQYITHVHFYKIM